MGKVSSRGVPAKVPRDDFPGPPYLPRLGRGHDGPTRRLELGDLHEDVVRGGEGCDPEGMRGRAPLPRPLPFLTSLQAEPRAVWPPRVAAANSASTRGDAKFLTCRIDKCKWGMPTSYAANSASTRGDANFLCDQIGG